MHPLLWPQWCSPPCNTLFITHQSDPPHSFLPSPSPLLLFLLPSPHLFIKLMRLKLGPSSRGKLERVKEDTQDWDKRGWDTVSVCTWLHVQAGVQYLCYVTMHFVSTAAGFDMSSVEQGLIQSQQPLSLSGFTSPFMTQAIQRLPSVLHYLSVSLRSPAVCPELGSSLLLALCVWQ